MPASGSTSFLIYHRVTGDTGFELDLPLPAFEQQMEWLAATGRVVSYDDAVDELVSGRSSGALQYVITFDDAYEDFYTRALPVLRQHGLPVTLFVPTDFIDYPSQLPLSRDAGEHASAIRPMTWAQLREAASDPLVTIGAHSKSHREFTSLSDAEIAMEMTAAAGRFERELGFVPKHFAYPRGQWNRRVAAAISQYCVSAVTASGMLSTASAAHIHAIPRVAVRRSDTGRWFPHRAQGQLYAEDWLITALKTVRRQFAS